MRSRGFSLMEVLVAMALLSVGMLGLAALQLRTVRATQEAHQTTQATYFAQDMADRMRANEQGRDGGAYDAIDVQADPSVSTSCEGASKCTPAELALYDAEQWIAGLNDALGAARGTVTADGDDFVIAIRWDDNRDGEMPTECPRADGGIDPKNDLGCYWLRVQPPAVRR